MAAKDEALRREHAQLVSRVLQPGDTITHEGCAGCIEEHIFLEYAADGTSLRGRRTADTVRLGKGAADVIDEIAPSNVTHINRTPVDVVELLSPEYRAKMAKLSARALAKYWP